MDSSQFVNEVLNSDICPEGFEAIYEGFQTYQSDVLKVLKEFHRVCEKNGVTYQLAFGSLLGAIRDGGQIPWDYDIDVIVPFEEKGKLIDALKRDLGKDYYFYCPEVDPNCRHVIMRIAPVNYRTEVLHVDVFYVTGTPNDEKERLMFTTKLSNVTRLRVDKLINIKEEAMGNPRVFLSMLIKRKIPSIRCSLNELNRQYYDLCNMFSVEESNFCALADRFAKDYIYPSEIMFKTKVIQVSYGQVRIPLHYDEILRHDYGDYMRVPPLRNRINEVIHSYNRITTFMKRNGKG